MIDSWNLDFSARTLHAGAELYVGEWQCAGPPVAHREVIRHRELGLQHEGAHVRTLGRVRCVVDPTIATLNLVGDEVVMVPAAPQRTTSVLVRGTLADELGTLAPRFVRVSPAAARLHVKLLGARDPIAIEETALALLRCIAEPRSQLAWGATPARRILAEEVQHVIATRFAERLTIETIAAACGASPFYTSRAFRAVTGETIHRHLTRVRLTTALYQLRRSAGRLTELAFSVGFSSHSHFTHAFQVEFGCAPSSLVS